MYIITTGLNPSEDFIAHHGIKGQKWGVRRYRVKGSSLTLANSIYSKASKKEPKITSDVSDALKGTSAKFYGLENRLKTKESIERKIRTDAKEKNISMTEASKIKDAIRYTVVSKDNDYVKNYNSIKKSLENKGYTEIRCKNYFDLYNKGEVKHKSVQSVFQNKDGDIFELQFQTPASQNVKDKKTPLYEEARNPNTSSKRKKELERQMELLAEGISTPKDIDKIKSHG